MSRRILIIEDDPHIREVAQTTLELVGGWTVLAASCGEEGLDVARREQPDAILLDVMMPDMDGIATLSRLRDEPSTAAIPVIFLTAKVQPADRHRFEGMGISGLISKPFDPMALPAQVARVLGWS